MPMQLIMLTRCRVKGSTARPFIKFEKQVENLRDQDQTVPHSKPCKPFLFYFIFLILFFSFLFLVNCSFVNLLQ